MKRLIGVGETERTLSEVIPAVARMYRKRCTRVGDCIVHKSVRNGVPQLRVRYVTMSAVRAVWWVSRGWRIDPECDVRRTCDEAMCVSPWHMEAARRGVQVVPAHRKRWLEGNLSAGERRRSYTPTQERKLRRLVSGGEAISEAARRVGMSIGVAHHVIAGRQGRGSRVLRKSRGRGGTEMCTRCQAIGHRRSSPTCPEYPEVR